MKKKFSPAWHGLCLAFKDPSIRIQFLLGALALSAGYLLKLSLTEWQFVLTAIGLVIAFEMINTAIELLCDHVTPEYHEMIKVIKDLSAGAVLTVSIMSLVIAGLILYSHLRSLV